MTPKEIADGFNAVTQKAYADGYVVTGCFEFFKPIERKVHLDATANLESPVMYYRITTIAKAKTVSTGETCITCGGSKLQRMGSCLTCLDCGTSNGCS